MGTLEEMGRDYEAALRMPYPSLVKSNLYHRYRDNFYFWARKAHQDFNIDLSLFKSIKLPPQERYRTLYQLQAYVNWIKQREDTYQAVRDSVQHLVKELDLNTLQLFVTGIQELGYTLLDYLRKALSEPETVDEVVCQESVELAVMMSQSGMPMKDLLEVAIHGKMDSFVYQLLPKLDCPDWKWLLEVAKEAESESLVAYFQQQLEPMGPPPPVPRLILRFEIPPLFCEEQIMETD